MHLKSARTVNDCGLFLSSINSEIVNADCLCPSVPGPAKQKVKSADAGGVPHHHQSRLPMDRIICLFQDCGQAIRWIQQTMDMAIAQDHQVCS